VIKKTLLLGILACLLLPAMAWADEDVTVGTGNMQIYGLMKAGFVYYIGQETLGTDANGAMQAMDRPSDMMFTINCFTLGFKGSVIKDRVSYKSLLKLGDSSFALLDLNLGFHYIPYTGIYVGRIKPNFTHFNAGPSSKFIFIDMPLMNRNMFGRTRQTGLEFGVVSPYLDANLGVFNGREYEPSLIPAGANQNLDANGNPDGTIGNAGWLDENNGKDFYLNLIGKTPLQGLNVRAGIWYGTPLDGFDVEDGELTEQNLQATMVTGGVVYLAPYGATFIAEVLYGSYVWDSSDAADNERADDSYEVAQISYYAMVGFNFGPMFEVPVEVLLRYDSFDPDMENDDETHPGSESDGLSDITFGVNYYLKKHHAMLSLNYIHHSEQWEDVLNLAGDDTQDGISNDELKLQAQVAF